MSKKLRLTISALAQNEVDEQAIYLEEAELGMGEQFLVEMELAVSRLTAFPEIGSIWPTENPRLLGLRRLILPRFGISIFYFVYHDAIEIVRVLHHTRDMPPLIEDL